MDELQQQYEKVVADEFFEWFNAEKGTAYAFVKRGDEAPDLMYGWTGRELGVEITAAYYDAEHGKLLWKSASGAPDAPRAWGGVNLGQSLAESIAECIRKKAVKRYGSNTLLLVSVPPGLTSFEELESRLANQSIPDAVEFAGIYVCGRFPITIASSGGYRVIPIKELK